MGADDILSGVAAVPGTQDFWAVGRYDGSDGFYHTLTERWSGSRWSVVKNQTGYFIPTATLAESYC